MKSILEINALGDISFAGELSDNPSPRYFGKLISRFKKADITIANLECPLVKGGTSVLGKCTLKAGPDWAKEISRSKIDVVSLANNHMMDYGADGLFSTIEVLEKENIEYLGAGRNLQEAEGPIIVEKKGIRLGFLARTSVIVSSPSYATDNKPGVAFLKEEQTIEAIKRCKENVDILILLVHWGLEHYHYPSPSQRKLARVLVNVGADLILGHHPHVLQGMETIGNSLVIYSLGNFLFDNVPWSFTDEDGIRYDQILKLTSENRKAGVLKMVLSKHGVESDEFIPTAYPEGGVIELDNTFERKKEFNRLCSRLKWPLYNFIWKIYSLKREWDLRIMPLVRGKMTWSKVKKIRLKHFKLLIYKMSHSAKITSEKTTDPYS